MPLWVYGDDVAWVGDDPGFVLIQHYYLGLVVKLKAGGHRYPMYRGV